MKTKSAVTPNSFHSSASFLVILQISETVLLLCTESFANELNEFSSLPSALGDNKTAVIPLATSKSLGKHPKIKK